MTTERSHKRKEVPIIGMREFRVHFQELTETVDVARTRPRIEIIGRFTPAKRRDQPNGE